VGTQCSLCSQECKHWNLNQFSPVHTSLLSILILFSEPGPRLFPFMFRSQSVSLIPYLDTANNKNCRNSIKINKHSFCTCAGHFKSWVFPSGKLFASLFKISLWHGFQFQLQNLQTIFVFFSDTWRDTVTKVTHYFYKHSNLKKNSSCHVQVLKTGC
jgi:hypothetical protein